MSKKINKKNLKAFSLVEISIVLIILGLLSVGATQGTTLIEKARLHSARSKTKNSPAISIPDLTFWVESTSENSFAKPQPNNNEVITLWRDISPQSSNPLDLNSVSGGSSRYKNNGINNLPSITFTTSSYIFRPNVLAFEFTNGREATMFLVQKRIDTSSVLPVYWRTGNTIFSVYSPWSGDERAYFDFGTCCTSPAHRTSATILESVNVVKLIAFRKSASVAEIFDNGKAIVTNSSATATIDLNTSASLRLGSINGELGEVMIFSRALTDQERQLVEAYLSQKWKIPLRQ